MATTKGFRLEEELRRKFELFCHEHLLDERAVVEAWLLRFLEASTDERQAVAKRYTEWLAQQMRVEKTTNTSRSKAKRRTP